MSLRTIIYPYAPFRSKSTSNEEHLFGPAYDATVDKQRTIVNEGDRVKAVLDIQHYLADKMYIVPMPREGLEPSPLAGADFKSAVSAVPPPRRVFDSIQVPFDLEDNSFDSDTVTPMLTPTACG